MPLPDFIVAGASRSGTTTLHQLFSKHPAIIMPAHRKELRFFDKDANFKQGLEAYASQFEAAKPGQVIGEVSPPYFHSGILFNEQGQHYFDAENDAMQRIHRALPQVKIIFTLRNPLDRAYSQYWKGRVKNKTESNPSFEAALEEELQGKRHKETSPGCYLYKNRYHWHLSQWLRFFPKEQMLVLVFEEWIAQPHAMLEQVEQFLAVVSHPEILAEGLPQANAGRVRLPSFLSSLSKRMMPPRYPPLKPAQRKALGGLFADDIQQLERLMNLSLTAWKG